MPDLLYHQWLAFEDAVGPGRCEPEAFLIRPTEVLLFEVKLTGCRYGHEQLQELYTPLLAHLYKRPVRCLQICRAVHAETPGPMMDDLSTFINGDATIGTLHAPDPRFL